jgi:hypothetical protein
MFQIVGIIIDYNAHFNLSAHVVTLQFFDDET